MTLTRLLPLFLLFSPGAQAGIFDLPSFLEPGKMSFGAEADFALTEGTGAALNLKPRYGLTDFLNLQGIIGHGVGDRRFRLGATLGIEYFPDVGNQPGLATPVSFQYMNIRGDNQWSLWVTPLVYKTFHGVDTVAFTPFVGLPVGWNARDGVLRGFTQIAFGTQFAPANLSQWKFTAELGFNLHQAYSYIAGGATFFISGYDWNRSKAEDRVIDGDGGAQQPTSPPPGGEYPAVERAPQSVRPLR